jgi:hypothetical protein
MILAGEQDGERVRIDFEAIIVMIERGAVGIGGERFFSSQLVV